MNRNLKLNEDLFEESGKIVDEWVAAHPDESYMTLCEQTLQKLIDQGVDETLIQVIYFSAGQYSTTKLLEGISIGKFFGPAASESLEDIKKKVSERYDVFVDKEIMKKKFTCINGGKEDGNK